MADNKEPSCNCDNPQGDPNYSICFNCDRQLGDRYYILFPFMKDVNTYDPEIQKLDYNTFNPNLCKSAKFVAKQLISRSPLASDTN